MRLLGNILRIYSYAFEAILCGMGILLSVFALASRNVDVHVGWLPWGTETQIRWVLALSLLGLICVALAATGVLRVLLFVFAGAVTYILFRGLFINTQYAFSGENDFRNAIMLLIGAVLAFLGSFPMPRRRRRRA